MCVRSILTVLLLTCVPSAQAFAEDGHDAETTDGELACVDRPPVEIARILGQHRMDTAHLVLTDCHGAPNMAALDELSILARPHRRDRPGPDELRAADLGPEWVAEGIIRVHPGLLVRLQAIADRWRGRQIRLVSGYRPRSRSSSRHHDGHALDVDVLGVPREEVVELALSLPSTGVGYYPNSAFTHIDVREVSHAWVDRSGPGERADYGAWPLSPDEEQDTREEVLELARAALDGLRPEGAPTRPPTAAATDVEGAGERQLTDEEIRELRASTVATLLTLLEPAGSTPR